MSTITKPQSFHFGLRAVYKMVEGRFFSIAYIRHLAMTVFWAKKQPQRAAIHLKLAKPSFFVERLFRQLFYQLRMKNGLIQEIAALEEKFQFNDTFVEQTAQVLNEFFSLFSPETKSVFASKDICNRKKLASMFRYELSVALNQDRDNQKKFINKIFDQGQFLLKSRDNLVIFYQQVKRIDLELLLEFSDRFLEVKNHPSIAISLAKCTYPKGNIQKTLYYRKISQRRSPMLLKLESYVQLLQQGYRYKDESELLQIKLDYQPEEALNQSLHGGEYFYLLHNTLPFDSGGYATRAQGLAKAAKNFNVDLNCVSRLAYPADMSTKKLNNFNQGQIDLIAGVNYYRLPSKSYSWKYSPLGAYLDAYSAALYRLTKDRIPKLFHAASNFMNGLAANNLARLYNIPSLYEVRGLWELTSLSRSNEEFKYSELYRMYEKLETQAANDANQVIAITHGLKQELINRGVDSDKIAILPNGVDCSRFNTLPVDSDLCKVLEIEDASVVFGYIGSIVDYEGLELLVQAAKIIKSQSLIKRPYFLIVGDGLILKKICALAEKLYVRDMFRFTGRVPHHEVERYYSIIDALVYPRLPLPVTEMVSPIKPLEAMAMRKTVIASSVAALAEMVSHGKTGLIFQKGNVDDLVSAMVNVASHPEWAKSLGVQAQAWVRKERDWSYLARILKEVYLQAELDNAPHRIKPRQGASVLRAANLNSPDLRNYAQIQGYENQL